MFFCFIQGGKCRKVEACPDVCYQEYWTIEDSQHCSEADEYYDVLRGSCIKALACPHHHNSRNCPLLWDYQATNGYDGGLLQNESFCRTFHTNDYSYGIFLHETKKCYSPPTWSVAQDKYEVLSLDNSNLKVNALEGNRGESLKQANYLKNWFVIYNPKCESGACKPKPGITSDFKTAKLYEDIVAGNNAPVENDWYLLNCL